MLAADHPLDLGMKDRRVEETLRDLVVEQTVSVERERRVVPYRIIDVQPDEPAEQQVVVELLHEQPLAANAVDHLQQRSPEQSFGRDRGSTDLRVARLEHRVEVPEQPVDELAQGPDRVVLGHPVLDRDLSKHSKLLHVRTAHRRIRSKSISSDHRTMRNFVRQTFSTGC